MAKKTSLGVTKVDEFTQTLSDSITMAVTANAGGTVQLGSTVSQMAKQGMVVQKIEYTLAPLSGMLSATGANLKFGLSHISAQPAAGWSPESPGLLDWNRVDRVDLGAAATGSLMTMPYVKDFTALRGGGKLCHPAYLYMWYWVGATALGATTYLYVRIDYTTLTLRPEEFVELWQNIMVTQPAVV